MSMRMLYMGVALLLAVLTLVPIAQAQDEATLANTANAAMQRMLDALSAALAAPNTGAATSNVNAAIAAGEEAIVALQALHDLTTNDVVRSRSKASLDQTSSAVNKARAALGQSPDVFRSQVQAAFAEVEEAIEEFAPVLPLVRSAPTAAESPGLLPRSGGLALDQSAVLGLALFGLVVALAGLTLRQRAIRLA